VEGGRWRVGALGGWETGVKAWGGGGEEAVRAWECEGERMKRLG
jgi:hypothetical protein